MTLRWPSSKYSSVVMLPAAMILASSPLIQQPIPSQAIRLLDALSHGVVLPGELREVIRPYLLGSATHTELVATILDEAALRGALRRDMIAGALAAEGCVAGNESPPCRRFSLRSPGRGQEIATGEEPAVVEMRQARARENLMTRERGGGAPSFVREEYVRSLLQAERHPLKAALQLFLTRSASELSEEDRAVIRAMATGANGEAVDRLGLESFRRAIGAVFRDRIANSRGRPEVVEEIRQLPEALLAEAWSVDRAYVERPLGGAGQPTECVVNAWRNLPTGWTQWHAWKSQLLCD